MEREIENETERYQGRYKGEFESSNYSGQDLSTKLVSVFQEEIKHKEKLAHL